MHNQRHTARLQLGDEPLDVRLGYAEAEHVDDVDEVAGGDRLQQQLPPRQRRPRSSGPRRQSILPGRAVFAHVDIGDTEDRPLRFQRWAPDALKDIAKFTDTDLRFF